jgi:excisionase family DNA binding protein
MEVQFFTTSEVAQLLKIKESTVRKWVREDKIDAFKLGRVWRISITSLKKFVGSGKSGRRP